MIFFWLALFPHLPFNIRSNLKRQTHAHNEDHGARHKTLHNFRQKYHNGNLFQIEFNPEMVVEKNCKNLINSRMYEGSQCRQAARVDWGVIGRRCRRNSPCWLTRGRFRVLLVLRRPAMVLGKVIDNCCKLLSCLVVMMFSLCLEHIWLFMAEDMETSLSRLGWQ